MLTSEGQDVGSTDQLFEKELHQNTNLRENFSSKCSEETLEGFMQYSDVAWVPFTEHLQACCLWTDSWEDKQEKY